MKLGKKVALWFVVPFALFFILFWVVPFLYGLYMSMHSFSLINGNRGFIAFGNYIKILFSDSMYHTSFFLGLKNTLIFVALSTPPLVLISLALALLVDHLPNKLKGVFRTIYFVSYSVSVTAVASIFIWMLKGNGGYFNNLLMSMKIISAPIPFLESQPFVWLSLTIATVWWTIGYNMMLFINALNEIDVSIYEASAIDGAGFWLQLKKIIMPNIRNVFFFVLMTTIIASFNVYGQPRLMTSGGPGQSTKPLIMIINSTIMDQNNMGVGNAMAILMGLIVMVVSLGQYFMTREKENIKSN
ncbi:MAG: sugar ABC transporter permease [Selenomonadaceae bacterium]